MTTKVQKTILQDEYIKRFAQKLRDTLNINTTLIDMKKVVKSLDGEIIDAQPLLFGYNGKVEKILDGQNNAKRFRIFVHPTNNEPKKRYLIARQLGHLFLHMGYLIDELKWASKELYHDNALYEDNYFVENREAYLFATNFLMPDEEYTEIFFMNCDNYTGIVNIKNIASEYGVSVGAAMNKARYLHLL